MRKLIITVLVCSCITMAATAQQKIYVSHRPTLLPEQQPLVFIDSIESNYDHLWINPENIQSIDILKDSAAIAKYGERAKNGVILIRTKPSTELIKLSDLITQYDISPKERNLKVCRDKILVENPDKILAAKTDIVKVEVITDTYWKTPMIIGAEEKFINIVTKRK